MVADAIGVSTTNVDFWLTLWRRVDEHLPLSHIAEVTHMRGFFWDAISVESSGGLNPPSVLDVPKPDARCFVDHVRARLNEIGPVAPAQPVRVRALLGPKIRALPRKRESRNAIIALKSLIPLSRE